MTPQDVLNALRAANLGDLENALQHIHPDQVFDDDEDFAEGAPLSIAAIDRMEPGDLTLLNVILRAGADPNLPWPDLGPVTSNYTPLVHAIYHGLATAISTLLRAGADPHRLILESHDPDWGVGFTPAMLLLEMPWLCRQVQDAPSPGWGDPTGRWELTVYDYHEFDRSRARCWGEEPSYAWIDLHPDGTFALEEWMGGREHGEWLHHERTILLGDDARALHLSHGGHAASINYTDEETGGRGDATFWYVRARVTQGHPLRPK